jgi:hypothetical protein
VWNYLGQRQLEKELGLGALYLVRWPLEEGDTLLVDNRTPHAGAASDGPDAFRLHWYAYVVDAAARIGVKDGDQEVVFDLLKHYPALCAYVCVESNCNAGENISFSEGIISYRMIGLRM